LLSFLKVIWSCTIDIVRRTAEKHKEHTMFSPTQTAVAFDRVQQLRDETRRAGQARQARAARRLARRSTR
jgi:hypothetical protein